MKSSADKLGIKLADKKPKGKTLTQAREEKQMRETLRTQERTIEKLADTVDGMQKEMNTPRIWDIQVNRHKSGLIKSLTCTEKK